MIACQEPGCDGRIDADGYCDTCGTAAPQAATAAHGTTGTGRTGTSTGSGRSSRTSSTRTSTSVSSRTSTSVSSRTRGTRGSGSTSRTRRGNLGANLVEVPPIPYKDPMEAVLANPMVPENKRFCSNCGEAVGRGRDGQPGRTEGFCRKCRHAFSFDPKLHQGDRVGQYEVVGCIAHGGLGWIYLAKDMNLDGSWVVLKGLLDSGDADAMAAAAAERRFLIEVNHPSIVRILNFVTIPDAKTGQPVDYIVMEYVGGKSLKEIRGERKRADGTPEPLAIDHAIAYLIEILPAFGYLHARGLVYNDFKPDNIIQSEEQLKLIDMGAVVHVDDQDADLFGTKGYRAPEIADEGPSAESDLYTIGRALAVLTIDFKGYSSTYEYSLPTQSEVPLFARHDSFYRLLLRATHKDPDLRFESATQMAEQLTAVLREVLSVDKGEPHPGASTMFSPEMRVPSVTLSSPDPGEIIKSLPSPLIDREDPAASFLAGLGAADLAEQATALAASSLDTPETKLRLVLARTALGDLNGATYLLDQFEAVHGGEWRTFWYRGLILLAGGRPDQARTMFAAVYDALPGEAAPKLAIAACAELTADSAAAARYYETVWRTDHSYVSAAFGLARVRLLRGERDAAVAAFGAVPEQSTHHTAAREAALRAILANRVIGDLTGFVLADMDARYEFLAARLDPEHANRLALDVLETALKHVSVQPPADLRPGQKLIGRDITERDLRFGLEAAYRALARLSRDRTSRIDLVDLANSVRPRTLV